MSAYLEELKNMELSTANVLNWFNKIKDNTFDSELVFDYLTAFGFMTLDGYCEKYRTEIKNLEAVNTAFIERKWETFIPKHEIDSFILGEVLSDVKYCGKLTEYTKFVLDSYLNYDKEKKLCK